MKTTDLPIYPNMNNSPWSAILLLVGLAFPAGLSAQCPDMTQQLEYLFENRATLRINERKDILDDVLHCCDTRLSTKTCKEQNQCAYARHRLGNLYLKIGELERGRSLLEAARDAYCDLERAKRAATDLGNYYSNQGQWGRAAQIYRDIIASGPLEEQLPAALELIEAYLESNAGLSEAESWWNRLQQYEHLLGGYRYAYYALKARIEQARGAMPEARSNWARAQQLASQHYGANSEQNARMWLDFGKYHLLPQNEFDQAHQALQAALQAYVPGLSRNIRRLPSVEQIGFIDDDIIEILELKATTFWRQYQAGDIGGEDLQVALDCFDLIVKTETTLRQYYETQFANRLGVAQRHRTIELALEICLELYQVTNDERYVDRAFHFSELVKDILLKEEFNILEMIEGGFLSPERQAEREALLMRWAELYGQETRTAQEKMQFQQDWSAFLDRVRDQEEAYFRFKYQYGDYGIADVRKRLLEQDQALVEYFVGEEHSFALVITPRTSTLVSIPFLTADTTNMWRFLHYLHGDQYGNGRRRDLATELAQSLYQELIMPLRNEVELPERLIIVSDGCLALLPFDVLIAEENGRQQILLERYITSMAYSAGMLLDTKDLLAPGERPYLGVAPIDFPDEEDDLPFSQDEVLSGQRLYEGDLLLLDAATKSNLLAEISRYDIIHLATHARADLRTTTLPYIRLAGNEPLSLAEIYHLKLNARLVILSACVGNRGHILEGDGLQSLCRGFNYAGAYSVLTTQWHARQPVLPQLVQRYLDYLHQGLDKDVALAQAKRDFLQSAEGLQRDPYFWANLIQFGHTTPLRGSGFSISIDSYLSGDVIKWIIGATLLVLLLAMWNRGRKYRRTDDYL